MPTYKRTSLKKTDNYEVVLIEFQQFATIPMHDHQGKRCYFLVLQGEIMETQDCHGKININKHKQGRLGYIDDTIGKHEVTAMLPNTTTVHIYFY